jgi:hypothetical protein
MSGDFWKYLLTFLPSILVFVCAMSEYFIRHKLTYKHFLCMDITFRILILSISVLSAFVLATKFRVKISSDFYYYLVIGPTLIFLIKRVGYK